MSQSLIEKSKKESETFLGVCKDENRRLVAELGFLQENITDFKEEEKMSVAKNRIIGEGRGKQVDY